MRAARILSGGVSFAVTLAAAIGAAGLSGCRSASRAPGCDPVGPSPCASACAPACPAPTASCAPACVTPCAGEPCSDPWPTSAGPWPTCEEGQAYVPPDQACEPTPAGWPPSASADCGDVWCLMRKPPIIGPVTDCRCVVPPHCEPVCVPAMSQRVRDYAQVCPPRKRWVKIPAKYECVSETYMTTPPRQEWVCHTTEDACGCRRTYWEKKGYPAKFTNRVRRVCVRPESCHQVWDCAKYCDYERCVEVRPPHVNQHPVPGIYETRTDLKCISPEIYEWRRNTDCEVPAPR